MFTDFFYALRDARIPVTSTEWMTFVEGLQKHLHGSSLIGFYQLARMTLVKNEAHYDAFDQTFAAYFHGIEAPAQLHDLLDEWLKKPIKFPELTPEQRAALEALDSEELRRQFEERLREQKERHDGGNRWIGTGGTSPFGHSGTNPAGIRVGGEGGSHSAVQVASARAFRDYRSDLQLDVRQLTTALRKLRVLSRQGVPDELDIDESIDETCRDGGEIHIVERPERKNRIKVLLLMDVGGTMDPYVQLVSRLFSAAHASSHFKRFKHYYFHNCVYDRLYPEANFLDGVPTADVLRDLEKDYRVIFIGDAYMYIGELTEPAGSIFYSARNSRTGLDWMKALRDHFEHTAWLNPMGQNMWQAPTVRVLRQLFPMYPLTLDGLTTAIRVLTGAEKAEPPPPLDTRWLGDIRLN